MQNEPPVQVSSQPPVVAKSSTGLDENIAALLSYVFGWISGLIFFLMEKDSRLVRFHAMQSTIVFGAIFLIHLIFGIVPIIGWLLALLLSPLIVLLSFFLWLFLMWKAFSGERIKLPYVGDIAERQLAKLR